MSASREETELFVWYDKQVEAIEARRSPLWDLERGELEKALLRRLEILRERQQLGAEPMNQSNPARPLPPLPADLNLFLFSSIQKAARLLADGASFHRVSRETKLDRHDAARLHWMLGRELFRMNAGELLHPDWRVASSGQRYALRFLDEARWQWVDPAKVGRTPG
jgi:hypothetical protein